MYFHIREERGQGTGRHRQVLRARDKGFTWSLESIFASYDGKIRTQIPSLQVSVEQKGFVFPLSLLLRPCQVALGPAFLLPGFLHCCSLSHGSGIARAATVWGLISSTHVCEGAWGCGGS